MNISVVGCVVLGLSLAVVSSPFSNAAESARPPLVAYAAAQTKPGQWLVGRGSTSDVVRQSIGEPAAKLTPDIWVYWDYRVHGNVVEDPHLDTLLVIFESDRVSRLRLVEGHAVRAIIAQLESQSDRLAESATSVKKQ